MAGFSVANGTWERFNRKEAVAVTGPALRRRLPGIRYQHAAERFAAEDLVWAPIRRRFQNVAVEGQIVRGLMGSPLNVMNRAGL